MASDVINPATRNWLMSRRWFLVAPTLLFLWIIAQIDKTNVSLFIADAKFLKELNLVGHNAELGGLMSTFFIGYGVSIFAWGFLVDRFGPRLCAIGGILGWGCALFLSSKAHGIQELLWIRFVLGVAEGNLWPVSNALTNRWFPVREHSRVQAFWITGSTLGTADRHPRRHGPDPVERLARHAGFSLPDFSAASRPLLFRRRLAAQE